MYSQIQGVANGLEVLPLPIGYEDFYYYLTPKFLQNYYYKVLKFHFFWNIF